MPGLDDRARPAGSGAHFGTEGCLLSRSLWDFRHSLVIEMHGVTGLRDGRASDGTSALRPFLQDAQDLLGLMRQILPSRANGSEQGVEHVDQMMLESDVAQAARAIALLECLQSRVVRVEGLEVGKDDIALDLSPFLHPRLPRA